MLATPVEGATVIASQIHDDGTLTDVASAVTGMNGDAIVDIGAVDGIFLLEARGGHAPELGFGDSVSLGDLTLESHLVLDLQREYSPERQLTISPITSVAAALTKTRFAAASKDTQLTNVIADTYGAVSNHIQEDIVHTRAIDIRAPNPPLQGMKNGVAIAGIGGLAQAVRLATGATVRAFSTVTLMTHLLDDASDDGSLLDGIGPTGNQISLGDCRPPEDDAICGMTANTWRSEWAEAIAAHVLGSAENTVDGAGIVLDDIRDLILHIRDNTDKSLFGDYPLGIIDRQPPRIAFRTTVVEDESAYRVLFDDPDTAEPTYVHDDETIELGQSGICPAIFKYVTRMDRPDQNPIHFEFTVSSGADSLDSAAPENTDYRIGIIDDFDSLAIEWLTSSEILEPIGMASQGELLYQIDLLRQEIPEFATREGVFVVKVQATDSIDQTASAIRCWRHVPLAAPLYITESTEVSVTDERSLHAFNLHPGSNLEDLLNGVLPLEEGKGILEFRIRNGTDKPVYTKLKIDQAVTVYSKNWKRSYTRINNVAPDPNCVDQQTCIRSELDNTIVEGEMGNIAQLASGLLIWDENTGDLLAPCSACDPDIYRLDPRLGPENPSEYRVMLVVTDLRALSPGVEGEDEGPMEDYVLDPQSPFLLTGRQYERVIWCHVVRLGLCEMASLERLYLALTALSLSVPHIDIEVQTSPANGVVTREYFDRRHPQYIWGSVEPNLPTISAVPL